MVLQLTDFHMNPRYEPGSNARCGEPTCCRAGQEKPPSNDEEKAGYWGDYRDCDTPQHAMTQVIQNAKKQFPVCRTLQINLINFYCTFLSLKSIIYVGLQSLKIIIF